MGYMDQLAAEKKAAQAIIAKGMENITADEQTQLKAHLENYKRINERVSLFKQANEELDRAAGDGKAAPRPQAKNLGQFYIDCIQAKGLTIAQTKNSPFITPEFKANTDTHMAGSGSAGTGYQPFVTEIDQNGVWPYERPLFLTDLLDSGTLSGNTLEYPVYGAIEGSAATVAEGGQKPQIRLPEPTWESDTLSEVAAWWKITDNMAEDLPFVVSEINSHGRYNLQLMEERQLLSGDGEGSNIKGLLNRPIQTLGQDADTDPDRVFKATTMIMTATGFAADAIVINPVDYQALRLSKDGNGQYYGGGFFTGPYGNGTISQNPPLWGLKTVVTDGVAAGTVLVGAFKLGGKVLRKGGLRVESTNSHENDFTNDKITFRIRERIGLQVRYPKAFVAVTLGRKTK